MSWIETTKITNFAGNYIQWTDKYKQVHGGPSTIPQWIYECHIRILTYALINVMPAGGEAGHRVGI